METNANNVNTNETNTSSTNSNETNSTNNEDYKHFSEELTIGKKQLKLTCLNMHDETYIIIPAERLDIILARAYSYALSMQVNGKTPYYFLSIPGLTLNDMWSNNWSNEDKFEQINKCVKISMISTQEDPTLKFPLILPGVLGENENVFIIHKDLWLFTYFLGNPYDKEDIMKLLKYKPTKKIVKIEEVQTIIDKLSELIM